MGELISTLLAAALVAGTPASVSNRLDAASGFALPVVGADDPIERGYRALLALDDAAQEEMDRWIREANAQGAAADGEELQRRLDERTAVVEKAYTDFLRSHPNHVPARIAYGSFLGDTGRESGAREQWEKALELDPRNPAIHNNLAGVYGHSGPIPRAFEYYEKAIALDPKEPIYYQNFATTVFMFRRDVMEHYGITNEQAVLDKALGLYQKAMELDPESFLIAEDLAQTYYLIKPPRHEEALAAWRRVYELAGDDLEREGVRVHLARIEVQAGRFGKARELLNQITNVQYSIVRERIAKTLEKRQADGASNATNAPPHSPSAEPLKPIAAP